jgi:SAM-dependent methyltransferase
VGASGRILGLDPSRFLVDEARRLAAERGAPAHLAFGVAEGTALPFPEGSWDLVLAATVLGHVLGPMAVMRELARVARRGGRVAVFDQDWETFVVNHSLKDVTRRILNLACDRREVDGWSGRRVLGWMRQAGLTAARCLPLAWVDAEYGAYMRHALKGRAAFAVQHGAITGADEQAWLGELEARANDGSFFCSITYYGFVGAK